MSSRQEILAEKKAKLAELRKNRESRASLTPLSPPRTLPNIDGGEIDNLVDSLIKKEFVSVGIQTEGDTDECVTTVNSRNNKELITYEKGTQVDLEEEIVEPEIKNNREVPVEDVRVEEKPAPKIAQMDDSRINGFLAKSMKIANRIINEEYDILTDYSAISSKQKTQTQPLVLKHRLWHESVVDRAINDICWSSHHKELIAVAFSNSRRLTSNTKGLIIVWNLHTPEVPEYVLNSNTELLTVAFGKQSSSLVYSTGSNGKLMSWDLRYYNHLTSNYPTQSKFQFSNHLQPVYSLIETPNELISASTDGIISWWDKLLIQEPISSYQIKLPLNLNSKYDILSIKNLIKIPLGLVLGGEDGKLFFINNYDKKIELNNVFEGHMNGVNALINTNNSQTTNHVEFLSCGLDWTIKLWRFENRTNKIDEFAPIDLNKPISTIRTNNIVMDLAWRNAYTDQFVSVGFEGNLEFWDLTKNKLSAIYNIQHEFNLNKCEFNNDGSLIAIGGTTGECLIYHIE